MLPAAVFRNDSRDEALAFISAHPFATIAVNGKQGPVTALVPLVINESQDEVLGHVARVNPFWKAALEQTSAAVAVFRGPDAYVSPSSYLSKKEHDRVVPTWNYLAVEVRGEISIETDSEAMMPFIVGLTQKMESHRVMPWQVSDAPIEYIEKLSRAIVGFSLRIDDITYVRKLSQNKPRRDKDVVIADLSSSENPSDRLVAKEMEKD